VGKAIAASDDTEFGLAPYFYSRDIARIWRVSEALEYGMVGVNAGHVSTAEALFGGVKPSGLEREGAHQCLDDFMQVQYNCMGRNEDA
jgi:succinate-semialdehyde dehydrogenase/glutarate-semialdehyde dehydrogenase